MAETSFNRSRLAKKTTLIFALLNLLAFFIYYTCFYLIKNQAALYFYFYFSEVFAAIMPALAATVLFVLYGKRGMNKPFLYSLYFSLTWSLNLFPYYAFEYAYQMIEISAVLTFAAIHTIFMVTVLYIEITVLYLLMIFLIEKIAKSRHSTFDRNEIFKKTNPLDFANPVTVSIFSVSAAVFIYNVVYEIIDTVSFIRDIDGSYEMGEIVYIVFRYLFVLAILIASHFLSVFVKNRISSYD